MTSFDHKSSVDEIRERFDNDVERFSNLETGQVASIDSPLNMELVTRGAAAVTPHARAMLDIGCGAGNYTLKMLERLPDIDVSLIDLSRPMLDRATERITAASGRAPTCMQGDIRDIDLGVEAFDIVLAAQALHHLRGDDEWHDVFGRIFASLRPGGSLWISDSLEYNHPAIRSMMFERWGDYLESHRDAAYRDHVMAYVDKEDTPRPVEYQLGLMKSVGFSSVDLLHVNSRFGSLCGVKA